jgi:hypothetical protein
MKQTYIYDSREEGHRTDGIKFHSFENNWLTVVHLDSINNLCSFQEYSKVPGELWLTIQSIPVNKRKLRIWGITSSNLGFFKSWWAVQR